MKLDELFGMFKKKEEPTRGSSEQRQELADKILKRYVKSYGQKGALTDGIRKLLKKDMLDPIELERNKLMWDSLVRTIIQSKAPLDDLSNLAGQE